MHASSWLELLRKLPVLLQQENTVRAIVTHGLARGGSSPYDEPLVRSRSSTEQ